MLGTLLSKGMKLQETPLQKILLIYFKTAIWGPFGHIFKCFLRSLKDKATYMFLIFLPVYICV